MIFLENSFVSRDVYKKIGKGYEFIFYFTFNK